MKIRSQFLAIAVGALALGGCPEEIKVPKDPPEARKDYVRIPAVAPVVIDVLANDFDEGGGALTLLDVGAPSAGMATPNLDGTVTYTPPAGFSGGATFTYRVQDESGNATEGTAYVTVGASTRVMYLSDIDDFQNPQLYLTDSQHPGVNIAVNRRFHPTVGPDISSAAVLAYAMSPDRTHVAYIANPDEDKPGILDVFVSDIEHPGASERITDLPDGRSASNSPLLTPAFSPDNRFLTYVAVQDDPDKNELYLVDRDNLGTHQRVHPTLEDDETLIGYAMAPDGVHIIYAIRTVPDDDDDDVADGPSFVDVFVTDRNDLSTRTKLNNAPTTGLDQALDGLQLSKTGTLAAYLSREGGSTTRDLYVVDYAAATPPVRVSRSPQLFGVSGFVWTHDDTRIVYLADELEPFAELFVVEVANLANRARVTAPVPESRIVTGFTLAPDDDYLIYSRADLSTDDQELFMVDLDAPGVATRVNAPLAEDETIIGFRVAPGTERRVLYGLDQPDTNVSKLLLVDLDTPGTTTEIGTGFTPSSRLGGIFAFDGTGQNVFYRADPDEKFAFSLQLVEVGTPTEVLRLTAERVPGAEVLSLENLP